VAVAAPSATGTTAVAPAKLELPSSNADYLNNPKAEYPRLSRQRNEQGRVLVSVFIGVDGTAQKAEIKVSSGHDRLDQAALATVKSWRYVPGKRAGVPEAMWFNVPIHFVLE
jgi:protein TonB